MLSFEQVRNVILEGLRERGYAPNPSDVTVISSNILAMARESEEEAVLASQAPKQEKAPDPAAGQQKP